MRKFVTLCALGLSCLALAACPSEADRASQNITTAADNFEVMRRVVFYNGITNEYILSVEGLCSLANGQTGRSVTVTCKTGPSQFKRHQLGLSDNVTFFAEQLDAVRANVYHYRVIFRPATILPNIQVQ